MANGENIIFMNKKECYFGYTDAIVDHQAANFSEL